MSLISVNNHIRKSFESFIFTFRNIKKCGKTYLKRYSP